MSDPSPGKWLKKDPKQTKGANYLLMILSFVLVIFVLEGGAWLLMKLKFDYPIPTQIWRLQYEPYLMYYSRSGLKDRDFYAVYERDPHKYRVLIIGGSTAAQMPPLMVSKIFEERTGKPTETIIFADGGYIVNQALIMLAVHGVKLKPDIVISIDGFNDIICFTKGELPGVHYQTNYVKYAVENPIMNGLRGLLNYSKFSFALLKWHERNIEKKFLNDTKGFNKMLDNYAGTIHTTALLATAAGAKYIEVVQPYAFSRKTITPREAAMLPGFRFRREFMKKAFQETAQKLESTPMPPGALCISALAAYDHTNAESFTDMCHLTKDGKEVLLKYILQQAITHGLVAPMPDGKSR